MFLATTVTCALLALCAMVALSPAHAQAGDQPAQLGVTVVPPNGAAPTPTGSITVFIDGRELLTLALTGGPEAVTSATPLLSAVVGVLGRRVTIKYSGDSNYEASNGITVTLPSADIVSIVARPKDTEAPVIEILAPRDGARYALDEAVDATYSCHDPDDRSAVTRCDGPVASAARSTPRPRVRARSRCRPRMRLATRHPRP